MTPRAFWRERWRTLGVDLNDAERSPPRQRCSRGHPDSMYGVTNSAGHRRCRKCLAENQAHHSKEKARVVSPPAQHTSPPATTPPPEPPPEARPRALIALGIGICSDCKESAPLFYELDGPLCRSCHPRADPDAA